MSNAWGITEKEYQKALELSRDSNTFRDDSADCWQLCRFYRGQVFNRDQAARAAHLVRAALAKAEGCCQFHASGGDKTLSCGGDIAKAEVTDITELRQQQETLELEVSNLRERVGLIEARLFAVEFAVERSTQDVWNNGNHTGLRQADGSAEARPHQVGDSAQGRPWKAT
jgi:hypothetical protein